MKMKWIKVEDALPIIPEGYYSVKVLVVTFDECYEELNPGKGHQVTDAMFGKWEKSELFEASEKNDFMELYYGQTTFWGPVPDPVTHWMYLPDPPKYKIRKKK